MAALSGLLPGMWTTGSSVPWDPLALKGQVLVAPPSCKEACVSPQGQRVAWVGWHPSPVGHLATYPPPPFVCTLCALGQSAQTNIRVWSSHSQRYPRGPGPSPHPDPRPFVGQGHRPQSMFSLRPQQAPGAGVGAAGRGFDGVDTQPVSLGEDPSLHAS